METPSLEQYASVLKVTPGGEEELFEGTVGEILDQFVKGGIGRPGALFMRLAGEGEIILGAQLKTLAENFERGH